MKCDKCGHELQIGDFPFCQKDGSHTSGKYSVIGDECDIWIEHGLCNMDGTPRRYRSKQEIAKVAKERGLEPLVEHKPASREGDSSPHTSRWI